MVEWFKALVLKTIVFKKYRGFESHPILILDKMTNIYKHFNIIKQIKKTNTNFSNKLITNIFSSKYIFYNNKINSQNLQFKYLKTYHSYHLVDPSPWPIVAAFGGFMITSGLVLYMHKFFGGWELLMTGFCVVFFVMYTWWRDVIREATFEDQHTIVVQKGLRLGMILFIVY